MSDTPTPEQVEYDSNPDTDEDEFNHRYDGEGNVEPAEEE